METINMETFPHLVSSQSLQRSKQPLRRARQPLRRARQPFRRTNKALRRSNKSLRRSKQFLRRSEQAPLKRLTKHDDEQNEDLYRTHGGYIKCKNSDHCSACGYRLTVRKLTKQGNFMRSTDCAPSRLPLRRIILAMRKRKNRSFLKHYFARSAPTSPILNKMASNFKPCCFQFMHMQHIFISSFGYFKPSANLVHKNISTVKQSLGSVLNCKCTADNYDNFDNEQYHISQRKLILSGDIERNPGPSQTRLSSYVVLEQRLRCFQLRPFDVGGDGDCFFRAVSHQLYGDPEQHLEVRASGIAYLKDNPERFIESNTENSWLEYLNNMSRQGTWGDAMIIQAVADQLKLKIIIAETHHICNEKY